MAISEHIRMYRIQKKLTQKQLGNLLYVSDKTISKWESGRSIPDILTIKKIAEILEVDYVLIIDGEDYNQRKSSIWSKTTTFFLSYKTLFIFSIILAITFIYILLTPSKVAYMTLMVLLLIYTIYLIFKYSTGYLINLMVILITLTTIIHDGIQLDLSYLIILLFLISLIMVILYIIKQIKFKNDLFFVNFLGNWNILLATLIFLSSFTIKYSEMNQILELQIDKQPGFIFYSICFVFLLFLHQYLYENKTYQRHIINKIKGKLPIVSVMFFLIIILSLIISTSVKLTTRNIDMRSIYVWKSYYEGSFTDAKTNEIIDLYGKENVTLSRYVESTSDLQIYAYTSNFIQNGVFVNMSTRKNHVEQVSLLYGEVWDENSYKRVIVIDKDTALNHFGKVDAVGEYISINQEQWKVIGVVTNTKAAENFLERAVSNGVDPNEIQLDSYAYIPYYFKDSPSFETANESYDSYIIRTQKMISGSKDENKIIDILVDGDNYENDAGDRLVKIGIITGNEILLEHIDLKVSLLATASLWVFVVLINELRVFIQEFRDKYKYKDNTK